MVYFPSIWRDLKVAPRTEATGKLGTGMEIGSPPPAWGAAGPAAAAAAAAAVGLGGPGPPLRLR